MSERSKAGKRFHKNRIACARSAASKSMHARRHLKKRGKK